MPAMSGRTYARACQDENAMMKGKPMIERSREPLFDDAPRPDAPVSGEPPRRSVLEA